MLIEIFKGKSLTSGLEAKRKFQIWRANTSTLLLDALEMEVLGDRRVARSYVLSRYPEIFRGLEPLSNLNGDDLKDRLLDLLNEALELDKLFSYQVAEVKWLYRSPKDLGQFDQDLMELELNKEQMSDGEMVMLVSAPGVIKCSKSTGEGFDVENILLKMEVGYMKGKLVDGREMWEGDSDTTLTYRR